MQPQRSHILVVDDHAAVRDSLEAMLVTEGFEVTSVHDGAEALQVFDLRRVDLAIVEVRVAGAIGGVEMVRRARARYPSMKALFMSDNAREPVCGDPCRDDFVTKPFHDRELLGCVYEILYRHESMRTRHTW